MGNDSLFGDESCAICLLTTGSAGWSHCKKALSAARASPCLVSPKVSRGNARSYAGDVVCLASYPRRKGINPAGSISPGERPRLVPIGITPDGCTALAARRADEPVLDLGQPHVIRPLIAVHCDIVAATVVLTIDAEPAHALGPEFGEGDFLRGD